jgi:hypothetical protein
VVQKRPGILQFADKYQLRRYLAPQFIAGLLVQPHDYIIRAGTEIEVLSTGEADIYLRIGEGEGFSHGGKMKTIWAIWLGVPAGEVPNISLWNLKLWPRHQAWRQKAIDSLPRREVVVAGILGSIW